jgi:hypothetical protein
MKFRLETVKLNLSSYDKKILVLNFIEEDDSRF